MEPRSSERRGQRASARKAIQSGGGRARGKRSQQRPRGGPSQQRYNNPFSAPLNSIRSDATAAPEAPSAPTSAPPAVPTAHAPQTAPTPRAPQLKPPQTPQQDESEPHLEWRPNAESDPLATRAPWLVEPGLYDRLHDWLADAMPFHWRERARHPGYWRRRAIPVALVVAVAIIAILAGNLGFNVAQQVTSLLTGAVPSSQQDSQPGSVNISPLNNTGGTPTPSPLTYSVGIWTANTMPTGGSVVVYVRVSNSSGAPVAKARVYLQTRVGSGGGLRLGPLTTDSYGMASAHLNYGGGSGTPVFLTATTTINGHAYSGTYTFVGL